MTSRPNGNRRLSRIVESIVEAAIRVCGWSAILFVFAIFFFVLMGNNHYIMRAIQQKEPERIKAFIAWLLARRPMGTSYFPETRAQIAAVGLIATVAAAPAVAGDDWTSAQRDKGMALAGLVARWRAPAPAQVLDSL